MFMTLLLAQIRNQSPLDPPIRRSSSASWRR
ncbi:Uncharacterised protein [Chromobacterium violaceum]|uniref:Uncharacterized protein n=1 Tax=Chromobacterium violaceum TaxID=536 RepID=A0A3S4LJ13_CHRVL|nr:Uncharacterised protein [Chromobacterium violaceum]